MPRTRPRATHSRGNVEMRPHLAWRAHRLGDAQHAAQRNRPRCRSPPKARSRPGRAHETPRGRTNSAESRKLRSRSQAVRVAHSACTELIEDTPRRQQSRSRTAPATAIGRPTHSSRLAHTGTQLQNKLSCAADSRLVRSTHAQCPPSNGLVAAIRAVVAMGEQLVGIQWQGRKRARDRR